MTGRDLLDAIGYVDENLLEHCQQTEQITARNGISQFWYGKTYVSIAACACLLLICILGVTSWQFNFSGLGDAVVKGNTSGMTASLDIDRPEETERLPKIEIQDGTDSGLAEDTLNETRQESTTSSMDGMTNDDYQPAADDLPDTDISSGTKSGVDTSPKDYGNTDDLPEPDTKIVKVDETDNVMPKYSQGIKIESVGKIPKGNPPSEGNLHPEGTRKPAQGKPAKKILAGNTVVIRGTVKKIQHFHATGGELDVYFSVVSLKVKEVYRADGKGSPQKGRICKVYLPATMDSPRQENSILGKLAKGSEVIMMPYIADAKTGIRNKENFFAFGDVSDYYFEDRTADSYLFLKTKAGVLYNTKDYNIPHTGKKVTLNDVGSYLKKMLKH